MYPLITTDVEPLDSAGFHCSDPASNQFLQRSAYNQHAGLASRTWVLRRSSDDPDHLPPVYGFYTLVVGNLASGSTSASAVLMPHFAIHDAVARKGFGRILLADALMRCAAVTKSAGALTIVATSRTDYGREWIDRHDFRHIGGGRHFLAMALAIRALSAGA